MFGWAKPVPVSFGQLRRQARHDLGRRRRSRSNLLMAILWLLVRQGAGSVGRGANGFLDGRRGRHTGEPELMALNLLRFRRSTAAGSWSASCPSAGLAGRTHRALRLRDSPWCSLHQHARLLHPAVSLVRQHRPRIVSSDHVRRPRPLSGMRPTGALHIGHFHGALKNWVRLQDEHPCFFFVADWHALTRHYETPQDIEASVWDMLVDWFAAGIDPAKATVFIQWRVPRSTPSCSCCWRWPPRSAAGARADYKDQDRKAERRRPVDLRLLGYPLMAGGRHPDLPTPNMGAGRRGPGAAHIEMTREMRPAASTTCSAKEPGFERRPTRRGRSSAASAPRRTWNCATATGEG